MSLMGPIPQCSEDVAVVDEKLVAEIEEVYIRFQKDFLAWYPNCFNASTEFARQMTHNYSIMKTRKDEA